MCDYHKIMFSVIIPTYNSAGFIENTLASVVKQTYCNFEVIISDDGSTDETVEVIRNYFHKRNFNNFKIIENAHSGPGATRNEGIKKAANDWIAFLDSDDEWTENKLEKIKEFITHEADVDLLCHSEKVILINGSELSSDYYKLWDSSVPPFVSLFRQNSLSTSAVIVRKEILIKAGMFDPSLPSAQDYDLWLRISLIPELNIVYIKEYLGYYLLRSDNITSNYTVRYKCLNKIFDKYKSRLNEYSKNPHKDKISFLYKINNSYSKNLIQDRKIIKATPYLMKLLMFKTLKIFVHMVAK